MIGEAVSQDDFWIRQDEPATATGYHVFLGGRFTFRSHDAFGSVLALVGRRLRDDGVIDLSAVTFMDTAALWMLQVARAEAVGRGRSLTIKGAAGEVRDLLRMAELEHSASPEDQPRTVASVVPEGGSWPDGSRPLLRGEATPERLSTALDTPYYGFVEDGADPSARCLEAVQLGGVTLSVTTATACSVEVVQPFAQALSRILGDIDVSLVELCLAEAVGNAAIHGNLSIDGTLRSTRKGFEIFSQQMTDRLQDPAMASRRIDITLLPLGDDGFRLSVSDRGNGFDLEATRALVAGSDAKHGRGIALIRQIAKKVFTEDGGRTLVMDFAF